MIFKSSLMNDGATFVGPPRSSVKSWGLRYLFGLSLTSSRHFAWNAVSAFLLLRRGACSLSVLCLRREMLCSIARSGQDQINPQQKMDFSFASTILRSAEREQLLSDKSNTLEAKPTKPITPLRANAIKIETFSIPAPVTDESNI